VAAGRQRRHGVALAVLAATAMLAASTANAGLIDGVTQAVLPSCGSGTQPFAQFGDYNSYFAFANNGFEAGASGWTSSGAAGVVGGNEPWNVNGPGNHSLSLGPGASAAGPLVCASLLDPQWRMFVRSNKASGALHAQIVFYGLLGNVTGILNVADFDPGDFGAWSPSPMVASLLALPLATSYAQLRLTDTGSSGSWQVDDVFVDPWAVRG
jgi:hypothetical protein